MYDIEFPSTVFFVVLPWLIFIGFLLHRGSLYLASLFVLISFVLTSIVTFNLVLNRSRKEGSLNNNNYIINPRQMHISSIFVPENFPTQIDPPPTYTVVMGSPPSYDDATSAVNSSTDEQSSIAMLQMPLTRAKNASSEASAIVSTCASSNQYTGTGQKFDIPAVGTCNEIT